MHGASENKSDQPTMRLYPCFGIVDTMPNSRKEVYLSYTTGSHPKRYAHSLTGNKYKQSIALSRSPRPHFVYPVNHIGNTLLGGMGWDDVEVAYHLSALFSDNSKLQELYINKWIEDYVRKWRALLDLQINLYST